MLSQVNIQITVVLETCSVASLTKKASFHSFILKFGMFANGLRLKRTIRHVYENRVFKCPTFVALGCTVGRLERKMGLDMNTTLFSYFFQIQKILQRRKILPLNSPRSIPLQLSSPTYLSNQLLSTRILTLSLKMWTTVPTMLAIQGALVRVPKPASPPGQ